MLITNRAPYTKNYKVLKLGNERFILCYDLLLFQFGKIYLVYKSGYLRGVVACRGCIYPVNNDIVDDNNTAWTYNTVCGIYVGWHHIRYCKYDRSVSLYGFKLNQYQNVARRRSHNLCGNTVFGLTML